jgi:ElaA protein
VVRFSLLPFPALSVDDLYDVLTLRQLVFSVEQSCAYLDCDGKDRQALHVLGREESGRLVAYARLLPGGVSYPEPAIGRVVSHADVRRTGIGKELMRESIARARDAFGPVPIRIGAQLYLQRFYESLGFEKVSEEYEEDGIPHIEMLLP